MHAQPLFHDGQQQRPRFKSSRRRSAWASHSLSQRPAPATRPGSGASLRDSTRRIGPVLRCGRSPRTIGTDWPLLRGRILSSRTPISFVDPKTVFDGAENTIACVPVTFKVQHVSTMCSSSADLRIAPSLVTCPMMNTDARPLGGPHELSRHFLHLTDAAWREGYLLRIETVSMDR